MIHGVVTRFLYTGEAPDGRYRYRARLEPRLALLANRRRNQLFAVSGPEPIDKILEAQLRGGALGDGDGLDILGPEDYSFKSLTTEYPNRDHVVQYNESDLDFLHRTLEHHGIFYFFEQTDSHEKVIFCDDNVKLRPLAVLQGGRERALRAALPAGLRPRPGKGAGRPQRGGRPGRHSPEGPADRL